MDWRKIISRRLPWLTVLKREGVAFRDSISGVGGAQCGEDKWVAEWLRSRTFLPAHIRYIEVGANQPTQLSNTWQLYQAGGHGVLIEPDPRCTRLLRRWRPRDLVIEAMAGESNGCAKLNLHKHTTMNSSENGDSDLFIGKAIAPVIALDALMDTLLEESGWSVIHLVSIDTEGTELKILAGAQRLLQRTLLVCLEHWGSNQLIDQFRLALPPGFEVSFESAMNVIFSRDKEGR